MKTKYNTDGSHGYVDNNIALFPEDDAAQNNWGGSWRMPTDADWAELMEKCTWTWTDDYEGTGTSGYIVTGSAGKSLFLPSAGHGEGTDILDGNMMGFYWSSNLDTTYPNYALCVLFESGGVYQSMAPRSYGYSVRPVTP